MNSESWFCVLGEVDESSSLGGSPFQVPDCRDWGLLGRGTFGRNLYNHPAHVLTQRELEVIPSLSYLEGSDSASPLLPADTYKDVLKLPLCVS